MKVLCDGKEVVLESDLTTFGDIFLKLESIKKKDGLLVEFYKIDHKIIDPGIALRDFIQKSISGYSLVEFKSYRPLEYAYRTLETLIEFETFLSTEVNRLFRDQVRDFSSWIHFFEGLQLFIEGIHSIKNVLMPFTLSPQVLILEEHLSFVIKNLSAKLNLETFNPLSPDFENFATQCLGCLEQWKLHGFSVIKEVIYQAIIDRDAKSSVFKLKSME